MRKTEEECLFTSREGKTCRTWHNSNMDFQICTKKKSNLLLFFPLSPLSGSIHLCLCTSLSGSLPMWFQLPIISLFKVPISTYLTDSRACSLCVPIITHQQMSPPSSFLPWVHLPFFFSLSTSTRHPPASVSQLYFSPSSICPSCFTPFQSAKNVLYTALPLASPFILVILPLQSQS